MTLWSEELWGRDNLREAIENVKNETETGGYDPEVHLNWSNLPMEMRAECVEWMDFDTRIRLRKTATIEKSLVDKAKKCPLEVVDVHITATGCSLIREIVLKGPPCIYSSCFPVMRNVTFDDRFIQRVATVLEHFNVRNFQLRDPSEVYSEDQERQMLELIDKCAPFQFERFECCSKWKVNMAVLNKCSNLKSLHLDFKSLGRSNYEAPYAEVFNHPVVRGVTYLTVDNLNESEVLRRLMQKWIETDAETGKSLFLRSSAYHFAAITRAFSNQICERARGLIRIRTNNFAKQILVQTSLAGNTPVVIVKMARSNLPQLEYQKIPRIVEAGWRSRVTWFSDDELSDSEPN